MNATIGERFQEAAVRMKMHGISPEIIQQFSRDGGLNISDSPSGICRWIKREELGPVRHFEDVYDALVYHIIRTHTPVGNTDAYLFVSNKKDEWEYDRERIRRMDKGVMVYTHNHYAPLCSGLGYVGLAGTNNDGLQRIW